MGTDAMSLFLLDEVSIFESLLAYLTPTAILVIVVVYFVLKDRATRKTNSNPGPKTMICPLNPPDLHADLREIVNKLEAVANLLNRLMGRLENGGRK